MAWNPNVPTVTNRVQDDLAAMRENFQHLDPLAQAVDELQTVSGLAAVANELQTVSGLAPVANELQAVSGLAPYVQALLSSRIVEMGSNGNGTYVRWENGLQICFFRFTSSEISITWTFPAAFVAVPVVQVSSRRSANGNPVLMNFTDEPNTTSVTIQKWYWLGSNWANAADEYAHLLAIGRWK